MQVPSLSVTAKYRDGSIYASLSLLSVGYALHQVWVFGALFNIEHFFGSDFYLFSSSSGTSSLSLFYLASIAAYLATLLIMGIFAKQSTRMLESRKWMIAAALCASIGTLFTFNGNGNDSFSAGISIVSGILTGLGSASLIEYWGYVYSQDIDTSSMLNVAISIPITMIIFAGVIIHLPYPAGGICLCLVPLVEVCILWGKIPSDETRKTRMVLSGPLPASKGRLLIQLGLPFFLCGFALGYLRNSSMSIDDSLLSSSGTTMLILGSVAACVVLLVVMFIFAREKSDGWETMFRIVAGIALVVIICAPEMTSTQGGLLSFGTLTLGYFSLGGFFLAFMAAVSQNQRISSVLVFGIGRGMTAFASMLTSFVRIGSETAWSPFSFSTYAYIAFILIMLALGFMTMPNQRRLNLLARHVQAAGKSAQERGSDVQRGGLSEGDLEIEESLLGAAAPEESSGKTGLAEADGDAEIESQDAAEPGEDDDAEAAVPSKPTKEIKDKAEGRAYGNAPDPSLIRDGCEVISQRYLLSQRETEVLLLLALGRNSNHIQKTLYVSEGTAKTHIRHIYRKTGVHKQQELIDLVESAIKS